MTVEQLLPELEKLSRADKFRTVQILVQQLALEDEKILAEGTYHVWSPIDAFGSANVLLEMLEESKSSTVPNSLSLH